MNIIHWEYSRIYLNIQIFATFWIGSPKMRAYSTVPFVNSVIYNDYRVTTEYKMGEKQQNIIFSGPKGKKGSTKGQSPP